MFDSPDYPKSLSEDQFELWMEQGRSSPLSYAYLLIIWNELDQEYFPVFAEERNAIEEYGKYGISVDNQVLVAAYDLYSQTRVA
ncbi:hypothetical protein [Algoriphagus confluentis]|uniref:Uncharacterized protein n=1 Tax=Algoriphagus confluentis TaxID=1697556 RepID=A0ABQ6PNW1_9BACT|nr:hypothetical protein Aconfl_18750 [Algoriphagus confluentis]